MRRISIYIAILLIVFAPGCSPKSSGNTVTVVKPKYHHRWFDRKNDKKVKRVKRVRVRN